MNKLKKFFGITEAFRLEWADLSAALTTANVALVLLGFWWAPLIGLLNCGINILLSLLNRGHINAYVMNLALIALNIYFLTL